MKAFSKKNIFISFILVAIFIIGITVTMLCLPNTTTASASSNTPKWSQVSKTNVNYNGNEYRVTLYEDKNFDEKQILFVSTPVYHKNEKASYTVTFTTSDTLDVSASIGITVSTEASAFGNGVKSSVGIKGTVSLSTTIPQSSFSTMDLSENDESGYWAVYGYNKYKHYKLYVEKKVKKQVYDRTDPIYGWKLQGCKKVWTIIGYEDKYKPVDVYQQERKYCGELVTKISNGPFIFDDMFLGSGK